MCYNELMVRKNATKTNILDKLAIFFLLFAAVILPFSIESTSLADTTSTTTFNVNVGEVLTVAITRPDTWASGAINTLLTNKVGVSVYSNNSDGFTATMKSSSATPNLENSADNTITIPTLTSASVTLADASDSTNLFPADQWGYSIVTSGDSAPITYYKMAGSSDTPISIASGTTSASKDIYFAAKADNSVASGTYSNSVVISVVSGVIDSDNPTTPTNPVTPETDTNQTDTTPTVIANTDIGNSTPSTTDHTIEVTTTSSNDGQNTTTTTETYVPPQGVTTVVAVNEGTPLATGLAVTAGISAAAGVAFFILAKRKSYDEDEDDGSEDY